MLQRLFLIGFILSITVLLISVINPAITLAGLPTCTGFAGEAAMKVVNGVTHLTYSNSDLSIIYIRINPDNSVFQRMVDTTNPIYSRQIKPTLEIVNGEICIFYPKNNKLCKAISSNDGADFTISEMESVVDNMPIITQNAGNWTSFITPYDAFSDSSYLYFSNIDKSTNDTYLPYIGTDEINGIVRSNSDIWIRQSGGGNNNGWPTFNRPVYTSGLIQSFSGAPPYAQIFRGGYFEHVPQLSPDFETMNRLIHSQGYVLSSNYLNENNILFVTVNGSSFTSIIGTVVEMGPDTLDIWTQYPPRAGMYITRNRFTKRDTIWTMGYCGPCSGMTYIVNCPLWIKGRFAGKQTWYSPYNIMINDNILLQDTQIGQAPSAQSNDYVALVSGKQIQVQYGYSVPLDSLRHHPNCDGDAEGVFIYASLYALNQDESGNPRKDGCFTFEYQHPHPSVPAVRLPANPNFVWDNIDLHRRQYPQTNTYPWPGNIDYPWYNPLWPEAHPYMERGTIHLYGSVYQQRRGFTHRSLMDTDYPNPGSIWDIDNDFCGGMSGAPVTDPVLGFTMAGINAPGATGSGVGYKKDYHADARIDLNTFPFNPFGLGMRYKTSLNGSDWSLKYYKALNEPVENKTLCIQDGSTALHLNNHLLWQASTEAEAIEPDISFADNEKLKSIHITNMNRLMLEVYKYNQTNQDSIKLISFNPNTNETQVQLSLPVISNVNSLFKCFGDESCFANLESDGNIRFFTTNVNGNMQEWTVWNPQITGISPMQFDLGKSRLIVLPGNADSMYVLICLSDIAGQAFSLYYANGTLEPVSNQDIIYPDMKIVTKVYPNPFKTSTTINIRLTKSAMSNMCIYNAKGQKIKTLCQNSLINKGEHDICWDGTDNTGKAVSNGIYFLKGNVGTKDIHNKLLLLK